MFFANNNFCGWQPSLLLHDLTSGSQWGSMNLHMNQAMADIQARQNLYMTPVMNFGGFSSYGMPSTGMDFLLDPAYTIGQWAWNNANNGFNAGFGGAMSGMGWGNFGWNGSGNVQAPSNQSASSPEERAAQKKYNKMLGLVKQLASADSKLPAARKEALDEIAKHPVGKTWAEKLENLQAEYNKVDKNAIKSFIASKAGDKLSVNGGNGLTNSFYGKLQSAGYEFENSDVDLKISKFYETLSSLREDQENYSSDDILGHLEPDKDNVYDILDVISSWNTQKQDSKTSTDKRIIDCIQKGYDSLPAGEKGKAARSSIKSGVIRPIVYALIDRARGLKENLDSASQTKITNAINKLEESYSKTDSKVDSNMSKAFDELYVLTRKAAIAVLAAEIKDYYGAVDSELFNNDLFKSETVADLKSEGFTVEQVKKGDVTVSAAQDSGDFTKRIDETKSAQEQVNDLVSQEFLAKAAADDVTGLSGDVYYDKNTKKVYVIKTNADGEAEIHEVVGAKAVNGKINVAGTPNTKKVSSNEIQSASSEAKRKAIQEEAVRAEQKQVAKDIIEDGKMLDTVGQVTYKGAKCTVYREKTGDKRDLIAAPDGHLYEVKNNKVGKKIDAAKLQTEYTERTEKAERLANSYDDGKYVFNKIDGLSDNKYYSEVNDKLAALNKDNVLGFVKGFYDAKSSNVTSFIDEEGMIEHLDDEWDDGVITMDAKKNLVNSFIEKAKELGFEKDEDYKAIKEIMKFYESGKEYSDSTTFNNKNGGILEGMGEFGTTLGAGAGIVAAAAASSGPVGWLAGAFVTACTVVGGIVDRRTDNEVIDNCMQSLMKKIQEKCPNEVQ